MALVGGSFHSNELKQQVHFKAYLPFDSEGYCKENVRVLILLHGLTDSCEMWVQQTTICSIAAKYNTLVFMPEGHRSFYSDLAYGNYGRYVGTELPNIINEMFGITVARKNMAIAGNSMGGYGAVKAAFSNADTFGFCGAFCPVTDIADAFKLIPKDQLFNSELEQLQSFNAPITLAQAAARSKALFESLPRLYTACGNQDFLCEQNREFDSFLNENGIEHIFQQWDGVHDWFYWNSCLEPMFKLFCE